MNRRQFVKTSAAAAAVAASGIEANAAGTKPPNILFVFADQQRVHSRDGVLTSTSTSNAYTPNTSNFRDTNFNMSRCYSNYPLCSPYRAMLQTGVWPHQNGVTCNDYIQYYGTTKDANNAAKAKTLDPTLNTVAKTLKSGANYQTGYVGKWDLIDVGAHPGPWNNAGNQYRYGFDFWVPWFNNNTHFTPATTGTNNSNFNKQDCAWYYARSNGAVSYYAPSQDDPSQHLNEYVPQYQTKQAIEAISWFAQQDSTTPWILYVSYNVPHPTYEAPNGDYGYTYDYAESGTVTQRNTSTPTGDPNPNPPDQTTNNAWCPPVSLVNRVTNAADLPADSVPSASGARICQDAAALTHATFGYYEGISAIDAEFEKLREAIANDPNLAGNTIIVYTSDHGDMMGAHRLEGKQWPFEESSRVPFYIGGSINGTAISGSYDGLFSTIDIAPTLCGLAGVAVPGAFRGKNFASVIKGTATAPPDGAYDWIFLLNGYGDPYNGNGDKTFSGYFSAPVYRGLVGMQYTYACVADNNAAAYRQANQAGKTNNCGPYVGGHWMLFDNVANPAQNVNQVTTFSTFPSGAGVSYNNVLQPKLAAYLAQNTGDPFVSTICNLGT